jgi:hypothetical protein
VTADDRDKVRALLPEEAGLAAGWLWAAEPTDRALAGWHPPVYLAPGDRAMLRAPFDRMYLPCGWTMRWYAEVAEAEAGATSPVYQRCGDSP